MIPPLVVPQPGPVTPVPGYQMNQDASTLLTWDFVVSQMADARYYWLSTVTAAGAPHAAPVWGIWVGNRLHFDGSAQTKWARNLAHDARVTVHLASGERVVILEGVARTLADDALTDDEWSELDGAYQAKYETDQGSPFRYVEPTKVLAWDGEMLTNMTRWSFAPSKQS